MPFIENLSIHFTGPLGAVVFLLVAVLASVIIYRSRTSVGFYVRKRWPIKIVQASLEDRKNTASILFIDDGDVPTASTLKDDSFKVEKARDARVDDTKVRNANIIFVDYKGVGSRISGEQQGMALANAIKDLYGHKKFVILYSAQEYVEPVGSRADAWLKKGASHGDYLDTIHQACYALFA